MFHPGFQRDGILGALGAAPRNDNQQETAVVQQPEHYFGVNLSWCDRLCGTYRDQPVKGHNGMVIGLSQFRSAQKLNLLRLLMLPSSGDPGKYPINRH